jgi:glycosyltransferase involved in cell wall biosynthesis
MPVREWGSSIKEGLVAQPTVSGGAVDGVARVAVAIPCYNEELTIAKVIKDFQKAIPYARIYVFNNNSRDNTAAVAQEAGAMVYHVRQQGKGHVMRAMFDTIKADALIVVDGDDTYFAEDAPLLLKPVLQGQADMVVGDRLKQASPAAFIQLNKIGNYLISRTINMVFRTSFADILSGYRVFSRRFVESVPLLTPGFETETELTLQALEEGLEVVDIPISYKSRPQDSRSKLRPFRDGWRIMMAAAILLRDHHPLRVYGLVGLGFLGVAFIAMILRLCNYQGTETLPDSMLAGIILLCAPMGIIIIGIGLMLSAINTRLREIRQIMRRNR